MQTHPCWFKANFGSTCEKLIPFPSWILKSKFICDVWKIGCLHNFSTVVHVRCVVLCFYFFWLLFLQFPLTAQCFCFVCYFRHHWWVITALRLTPGLSWAWPKQHWTSMLSCWTRRQQDYLVCILPANTFAVVFQLLALAWPSDHLTWEVKLKYFQKKFTIDKDMPNRLTASLESGNPTPGSTILLKTVRDRCIWLGCSTVK